MRYRFLPAAERELEEAVEHYDRQRSGLGREFAEAVRAVIDRIVESPDTLPLYDDEFRYCQARPFSYIVLYGIDDVPVIVAIAHTSRRPGYWKDRIWK